MQAFPEYIVPGRHVQNFSPYESNGGTIIAIAGQDYAVIASDTRLSSGYTIHTRQQNKLFQLTPTTVLGSVGCWCDSLSLTELMRLRVQKYQFEHGKSISTEAIANMLSIIMYSKRFFPYYVANVVAGLDKEGKGAIYSYDPIGHCQLSLYHAGGTSGTMLQSVLDNQMGSIAKDGDGKLMLPLQKALELIKDAFISAAERDIYTGDYVIINIITKDGIKMEKIQLRMD